MPKCNICSCTEFINFNNRKAVQCANCGSLERHRLVREVLEQLGFLNPIYCFGLKRVLHLAPEAVTYKYLFSIFGSGYYCSDMLPEKYPHCQALKLALPDGFDLFPKSYFDLILHNHVLEHIPGSYKDHLRCFVDILKPGGYMIFTIPFINFSDMTIEGGENLPSDAERLRIHGQGDHYKTFGKDLLDYFNEFDGAFSQASVSFDVRHSIGAPNDVVYVFRKSIS